MTPGVLAEGQKAWAGAGPAEGLRPLTHPLLLDGLRCRKGASTPAAHRSPPSLFQHLPPHRVLPKVPQGTKAHETGYLAEFQFRPPILRARGQGPLTKLTSANLQGDMTSR